MHPLSASQLLSLWEYGLGQPPWQRALTLLTAALPDVSPDALAILPLGERDAYLLALRETLFGPRLNSLAACPKCAERLELTFDVADVRMESLASSDGEHGRVTEELLSISLDGFSAIFRLPNSLDLAQISGMSRREQAWLHLLECCLISVDENGVMRNAEELPNSITAAIAGHMAAADPQGDIQIDLACPSCAHEWQVDFDILSFLWMEIHAWAQRILREVHLLARAYGWREAEIMALSPWRRQAYLQMIMG